MQRLTRYLFTLLCGGVLALLVYLCLLPLRRKHLASQNLCSSAPREAAAALFWMFCGGMALLTLTPWWVSSSLLDLLHGHPWNIGEYPFFELGAVNLVPFRALGDRFIDLGNIIMFVPFGFFAALLWREYTVGRVLGTGLAITGSIECWQIFIGRAFDIDDLLLNTLGVLAGYGLWRLFCRLTPGSAAAFQVKIRHVSEKRGNR